MSTFQSAYKSQLQGVSQQLPEERLPGQVTAQVNMMSDPVTNMRRRPGTVVRQHLDWPGATPGSIMGWFTDLAGQRVHILLNINTGVVRVLDEGWSLVKEVPANEYLVASDMSAIRATTVSSEFVLANVNRKPSVDTSTTSQNPANSGFFFVQTGAFSKKFDLSVDYVGGRLTAEYTTPSGSGANDAALATPEYIAQQLAAQIAGNALTQIVISSMSLLGWSPTQQDAQGVQQPPDVWLQVNLGNDFAPNWQNVSYPLTVTPSDLGSGKYRVFGQMLYTTRAGFINTSFQFTASTAAGALPGTYTSQVISVATVRTGQGGGAHAAGSSTVPLAAFAGAAGGTTPILTVSVEGPYVFITRSGGLSVSSTLGTQYIVASRSGYVRTQSELPARLPPQAEGYICRVGSGSGATYYRYNSATGEWLESGEWGGAVRILDCPVSLQHNDSEGWHLNTDPYEGRLSGDDESNPAHRFMTDGITGVATYQGRLVLFSGPRVSMSASNRPRRFFRSTVTSVLGNDPIEIGSGMTSAASYEWGLPFNKDLLVFSRGYQAVVPSGNTAITPSNAMVTPTSSHEVDTTGTPVVIGRTLMFCSPRSEDFFGVMEMVPSNYTDSQYVSQDSTPHLPKYMPGRCRFAVSSSVASMALFAPSGDPRTLLVHEYHWDGDSKVQQAWHKWTFEYDIEAAYFATDLIVLVHTQNEVVVMTTIDPRAGFTNAQGERRPYMDMNIPVTAVNHVVTIPPWMLKFDPALADNLRLTLAVGGNAGEWVGAANTGSTLRTVRSNPNGQMMLGVPYYSGFIPTPPLVRDYEGNVIHTDRATLLRFVVGTRGTSLYHARVSDDYSGEEMVDVPTLTFSHPELQPGRALYSVKGSDVVPCRTDMRSTSMELYTTGYGEMNITSLEYVGKYQPRIKRR